MRWNKGRSISCPYILQMKGKTDMIIPSLNTIDRQIIIRMTIQEII